MRLHLNVRDRDDVMHDLEGFDFDTLEAAVDEANLSARQIMAERLRWGQPMGLDGTIEIADESGRVLQTVSFEEAIPGRAPDLQSPENPRPL